MKGIADLIYTYRFIKIMSMKWTDTDAYKLGIIDSKGNQLMNVSDLKTTKMSDAYTPFIRLVFNIKRVIEKSSSPEVNKLLNAAMLIKLLNEESKGFDVELSEEFTKNCFQWMVEGTFSEDTPTNVTGSAVSTSVDRPLNKNSKPLKRVKMVDDPDKE